MEALASKADAHTVALIFILLNSFLLLGLRLIYEVIFIRCFRPDYLHNNVVESAEPPRQIKKLRFKKACSSESLDLL